METLWLQIQSLTMAQWLELLPYIVFALCSFAWVVPIALDKFSAWRRDRREPKRTGGGLLE